jgi:hypothetical protein
MAPLSASIPQATGDPDGMARRKMNTSMRDATAPVIKPDRRSAAAAAEVAMLHVFAAGAIVAQCLALSPVWAASGADARADEPLVVNAKSHVVVMEYEAWWGPKALTFKGTTAKPELQSKDMKALGGGYDSADPAVIRQHVEWLEHIGVDAAIAEVTNNVSCIFNSEWFVKKYLGDRCPPLQRSQNQKIRDNTGNLYPGWAKLKTRLKLMPLLGGIDQDVLYTDLDGKTALGKEVDFFGALMARYPELNVIYEGKPLMMIFLGAAQDPDPANNPLWFQIREFLKNHPAIGEKYTFRLMAGYLDSQPGLWAKPGAPHGPVPINAKYGFWSWVDRLKPDCKVAPFCPYYPSYNKVGERVENFTASIATAGQSGWGCPDPNYCPDDALRYGLYTSYATFDAFMAYARELDPIFLIIHQFNEFGPPDEGFDANTDDDIEPANLWGMSAVEAVRGQISLYRR